MSDYVKGSKPRDLDAAKGGLVLDRIRSFVKDPDPDYHPMGTGELGPFNTQEYEKKGKGDGDEKRTGDKSLPMSTLKKSNNRAV
jgi:hypothetical protein